VFHRFSLNLRVYLSHSYLLQFSVHLKACVVDSYPDWIRILMRSGLNTNSKRFSISDRVEAKVNSNELKFEPLYSLGDFLWKVWHSVCYDTIRWKFRSLDTMKDNTGFLFLLSGTVRCMNALNLHNILGMCNGGGWDSLLQNVGTGYKWGGGGGTTKPH
jgi:hypothetical protein